MLFKLNNRKTIRAIILTSSLTVLASCSNSAAIEGFISADPKLKEGEAGQLSSATQLESTPNSLTAEDREDISTARSREDAENTTANGDRDNLAQDEATNNNPQQSQAVSQISDLPFDFPGSFPVYPQAELEKIRSDKDNSGMVTWNTTDNRKAVADYYQAELLANDWELTKPFTISPEQKIATATAVKDDLRLDFIVSVKDPESDLQDTQLSVIYHSLGQNIADGGSQANSAESQARSPQAATNNESREDRAKSQLQSRSDISLATNEDFNLDNADFADLDDISEQLQQPLKAIAGLGCFDPVYWRSQRRSI